MKISSVLIGLRTDPPEEKGKRGWAHFLWTVTLTHEGRTMDTPWKAGTGNAQKVKRPSWSRKPYEFDDPNAKHVDCGYRLRPTPPTAADVLECLCSDASGYDNARGFEDWAAEFGYSADSRKAEALWHTVAEQSRKLRQLLGADYARLCDMDEDERRAWVEASEAVPS